jgi:glycosyltransferase involved in cell wall biosynthesis
MSENAVGVPTTHTRASQPLSSSGPGDGARREDIRRRRVYHVVARGVRDQGGVGRYLSTLLAAWPADGSWSLHVIDPYGHAGLAGSPLYWAAACVRVVAAAVSGRMDVLHLHACARGSFLRKGLLGLLASRLGVPVIFHLHAPDFDEFYASLPSPGRRFARAVFRRTDRVVVLGRVWRDLLVHVLGLPRSRVVVLHSGVRGPARGPARQSGVPQIVFTGNLVARKGLPELLQALRQVEPLPWVARILGGGDLDRWRGEAGRLGLADRVAFEGWVTEARVREVLSESSIFVLPSYAEGLSIALLEAMAFGLAIVTTTAGGAADVLRHGESALFVPAGHVDAVAGALARLLQDATLRGQLQDAARQRFAEAHDIEAYCRSLSDLYEEVCAVHQRADRSA